MRKDNNPTEKHLKELYEAASDFKQAQPWNWLYDTDIIYVENPKDKIMGYCSVMGGAGEHYALGVYLGGEGLYGFYQMIDNADTIPRHQLMHYQNSIMCSFEDRDMLTNEDRKQIKDLGLAFRGRNAWPLFRRYEPGFHPWFINDEECVFLTHALRQTLFVAENVFTGRLKMDMEQGKTIVRYSKEKNGKLEWFSKEEQLHYPTVTYTPVTISDEVLIHKIKNAGNKSNIILQADIYYAPSAVRENKGERPYYPRILMLAEQKSGMILGYKMYENINDDASIALSNLAGICMDNGIPEEIKVRSEALVAILGDFCRKTGIRLKHVKKLPVIDHIMNEMAKHFEL